MQPRMVEILGEELVVVWDDGHESYYPLEILRRACPCAGCSGEPDLFGNIARGPDPIYVASSFKLDRVQRVGNYALEPDWSDGHTWGIWTYDRLRAFCRCGACDKQ